MNRKLYVDNIKIKDHTVRGPYDAHLRQAAQYLRMFVCLSVCLIITFVKRKVVATEVRRHS